MRQLAADANALDSLQCLLDRVETPLPVLQIFLVTTGSEATKGGDESDDLLPSDLHRTPEPLVRHSDQVTRIEQRAPRPRFRAHIHVLVLERDGGDQIGPAGKDAAGLWPADRFAAREDDQIRAFRDESAQVCARRQLSSGINDDWNTALVGDLADRGQRHRAGGVEDRTGDRRRALGDRCGELPRACTSGSGIPEITNLDHAHSDGADSVVVGIAVAALDDHLVLQSGRVRQAIHRRHVHPGDAGGHPQREASGCSAHDVAGLGTGDVSDNLAGSRLQGVDRDERGRRVGHRRQDLRGHAAAAQAGQRSAGVDDCAQPELVVYAHARNLPSSTSNCSGCSNLPWPRLGTHGTGWLVCSLAGDPTAYGLTYANPSCCANTRATTPPKLVWANEGIVPGSMPCSWSAFGQTCSWT